MKVTRNNKGITLIALIITIVVLLILAVVSINSIQNEGILSYAENATAQYEKAQENESQYLQGYLNFLQNATTQNKTETEDPSEDNTDSGDADTGDTNTGDTITFYFLEETKWGTITITAPSTYEYFTDFRILDRLNQHEGVSVTYSNNVELEDETEGPEWWTFAISGSSTMFYLNTYEVYTAEGELADKTEKIISGHTYILK